MTDVLPDDPIDALANPELIAEEAHYRVAQADTAEHCEHCGHGAFWTIVFKLDNGEECEIGSSWADRELAEDICDHMNTAYEYGVTDAADAARYRFLRQSEADMGPQAEEVFAKVWREVYQKGIDMDDVIDRGRIAFDLAAQKDRQS